MGGIFKGLKGTKKGKRRRDDIDEFEWIEFEDETEYEEEEDYEYENEEYYEVDEDEEYYEEETDEYYEADGDEEYYEEEDDEYYEADEDEEYYGEEDDEYYEIDEDEEYYEDDEYYETDDEDDEESAKGIKKIFYKLSNMSAVDHIVVLTGAAVFMLAVLTGVLYFSAKKDQAQIETFAEIGTGMENITVIGESGLIAIADAQSAKLMAAAMDEPDFLEQEQDEQEEKGDKKIEVVMNLTSIQKDLKIKFINKTTGKLISNVGFAVEIENPSGKTSAMKDDDKDGIIYQTGMEPGRYQVKMTEPASDDTYSISSETSVITVRDTIEYKKVDVSDEVKTEAQVNAAVEDTKVNETVVESVNTDTVEWVESTKTLIEGTETSEDSYEKVSMEQIADPGKSASASLRLLASEISLFTDINDTTEPEPNPDPDPDTEATPTPEPVPPQTPEPEPTSKPVETPEPTQEPVPTEKPAETPQPTEAPTEKPTAVPTVAPTEKPTTAPTEKPIAKPTAAPTEKPIVKPTAVPTEKPTVVPTAKPTATPKAKPTATPTKKPTASPTAKPTVTPTATPKASPTATPTTKPDVKKDTKSILKTTSGETLWIKTSDGSFREAKYADYYTAREFYRKVRKTTGEYRYTGWQVIDGTTFFFDKNGNKVTGEQVIQGAKYNFNSDGSLNTSSGNMGIDVSKWNGSIDWNAVKNSGVSYVIIRCGYRGSTTGALIEDPMFRSNIQGASNAGLKVGVYFFTQAVNEVEAVEEASMVLGLIKGYNMSYPVFLDVEASNGRADSISASTRTSVCKAFCQTIQNSGYKAGVYANKTWLNSYMDAASLTGYKIWLAQYAAAPTYSKTRYDMWQYSSKGNVSGIKGGVDMNISYMGY